MRVILYKESYSDSFERYVDIGSCERDHNVVCIFRKEKETYKEWFEKFLKEDLGSQMITLNFYLLEFKNSKDDFSEFYGDGLNKIISENFELFNDFNATWFDDNAPIFNGLDLNWDGVEDEIEKTEEKEDGTISKIEFEDGSVLKFLDEDDSIKSFYVAEEEYEDLVIEVKYIVEKFK